MSDETIQYVIFSIFKASEYLQQLPLEKLPITGSAGAMFRRQQLQKQIPLHDFKVNNCHDLTQEETVAYVFRITWINVYLLSYKKFKFYI